MQIEKEHLWGLFHIVFIINMAYAQGKKALGICDRCGFTYKLRELRYEVENKTRNGLKVCYECFDPDHPQFDVNNITTIDPQALYDPRVDTGEQASREIFGFNPVTGTKFFDIIISSITFFSKL